MTRKAPRETAHSMAARMQRHFFGGTIRLHILHHAAEAEVFGQWLIDELAEHGYRLSPGTLYPILHGLERGGYLRSKSKHVEGRVRRMYRATPSGRVALLASQEKVAALLHEIVDKPRITASAAPDARHRKRSIR
jgi:DNA-binding PadR family transcriptional regulator